ncbi:MAG: hypothetical protein M5R37_09695 [Melioribacteraceae bacterium]|nr:hypothetical protein [Melioribacteraceae bacterium]
MLNQNKVNLFLDLPSVRDIKNVFPFGCIDFGRLNDFVTRKYGKILNAYVYSELHPENRDEFVSLYAKNYSSLIEELKKNNWEIRINPNHSKNIKIISDIENLSSLNDYSFWDQLIDDLLTSSKSGKCIFLTNDNAFCWLAEELEVSHLMLSKDVLADNLSFFLSEDYELRYIKLALENGHLNIAGVLLGAEFEKFIKKLSTNLGANFHDSLLDLINNLQSKGKISESSAQQLHKFRKIRNAAIHHESGKYNLSDLSAMYTFLFDSTDNEDFNSSI